MLKIKILSFIVFLLVFFISASFFTTQINAGCGCPGDDACPSAYGCFGAHTDPQSGDCVSGTCEQTGCGSNVVCGGCTECAGDYCAPIPNCTTTSTPKPGGGSCVGPTNCPSGWTPSFGQTPTKIRTCDQSDPPVCSLGTAQKYLGCCTAGNTDENGEWYCGSWKYATYPCCPPGTAESCTTTPQGTHEIVVGPYNAENGTDVTAKCYPEAYGGSHRVYYCYAANAQGTKTDGGRWTFCYHYVTCQKADLVTCSCQPTCTATAPSAPTLLSPANGGTVSNTTVSLVWNDATQNWGTSCTTNTNTYEIYIGTAANSLALLGTANSGIGSTSFGGGTPGNAYYWKVRAKNGSLQTDSAVWSFTINSGPWWQTKDGDVTTNNDISSDVRTGQLFSVVGLGGFPGLPTYGDTFNLSSTPTLISTNSWNANTLTIQPRLFNYSYFKNLIPDEVINSMTTATDESLRSTGFTYEGYEWFKANTSLTIESDIDFGNRKVILFVENGNLSINGRINLNNGLGFFGTFVNGSISVDPTVTGAPSIEGFFQADSGFSSGAGTDQLHIRGSVVSYGSVNLERDLVDNSIAGELFEFAPDLLFNFPSKLGYRRSKWTEVAP